MSDCCVVIGAGPLAQAAEICAVSSHPELVHSSDCNEALVKCTLIRSLLKSIFPLVFVITSPCFSTSGSATQVQ